MKAHLPTCRHCPHFAHYRYMPPSITWLLDTPCIDDRVVISDICRLAYGEHGEGIECSTIDSKDFGVPKDCPMEFEHIAYNYHLQNPYRYRLNAFGEPVASFNRERV